MQGTLTAAFGRQYEVRLNTGELWLCVPRGKKSLFACGDKVDVTATGPNQGVINRLLERETLLYRSDQWKQKLIAANVSQVVVVVATEPSFSPELVSRCLAAAEHQHINGLIVLNKTDLTDKLPQARDLLAPYLAMGYGVLELSAQQNTDSLLTALQGHTSLLVGQSGMGKSTLTNALIPQAQAQTREISAALDTGKHTTTFARLYDLPDHAGHLIDSPGLQVFGLSHLSQGELEQTFRDFQPFLGSCRFRNCRHLNEPGCAIQNAVTSGSIHRSRFEHFHTLLAEIEVAEKQRLIS